MAQPSALIAFHIVSEASASLRDARRFDAAFDDETCNLGPAGIDQSSLPAARHRTQMDRVSPGLDVPIAGLRDEDDVIRGFLAGEPEATVVIDGWIETALRAAFASVRDDWDDLRQEIRIRILNNLEAGRFNGDSALRTYVHGITRNVAIDLCRMKARHRAHAAPAAAANAMGMPGEQERVVSRDLLEKILEGVSDDDRRLLDLVHGQHLPLAEVAAVLGVPVGTVKSRVFRCRQRLLMQRERLLRGGR